MENIFELFSQSSEASPTLLAMSILEPVLAFIAFIFLLVVSLKHYLKTKSLGALLVLISLMGSVIVSVFTEVLANDATSNSEVQLILVGNMLLGVFLLTFVYGFKLICNQAQQ